MAGRTLPHRRTYCGTMGDGLGIRSRAVKAMPEEAMLDDLDAIKGSPWAPSGVLRDVLPDVPRLILSRDEPPFLPVEERPVARTKTFRKTFSGSSATRQAVQNAGNCRATNIPIQAWHTQDCRSRVEAASRTDPVHRDRAERAEQ